MTKQLHQTDVRMAMLNQNYVPKDIAKFKFWKSLLPFISESCRLPTSFSKKVDVKNDNPWEIWLQFKKFIIFDVVLNNVIGLKKTAKSKT
jgi:hypothetical protein